MNTIHTNNMELSMASRYISELSSQAERLLDTATAHRDPDFIPPVFTHLLSVVVLAASIRKLSQLYCSLPPGRSNPASGPWISECVDNNYENTFDRDLDCIHNLGDFNAIGDQV